MEHTNPFKAHRLPDSTRPQCLLWRRAPLNLGRGDCRWGRRVQKATVGGQRLHNIFLEETWIKNTEEERQADPCVIVRGRGGGRGPFHGTAGRVQCHLWVGDRLLVVEDGAASRSTSVAALSALWKTNVEDIPAPLSCNNVSFLCHISLSTPMLPGVGSFGGFCYRLFIFISAPGDVRAWGWRLAGVKRGR